MEDACRITVPSRKATEAMLAAHVCQLIASGHGELHGGEGFYDNFYIRDGARALGKEDEAQALEGEAADYRAAIDAAHRRTGVPHFPPSWEGDGTHWGNTETLWPTAIFEPDDERAAALIRHVREDFGGGYVEGSIRWLGRPDVIHPYMGAYTTMASLLRGEPWHLNVIGVELRSARVERIIFRDLGTPAAPVLVGVTLEE